MNTSSSPSSSWFFLLPEEYPWTSRSQSSFLPPPLQLWNTSSSFTYFYRLRLTSFVFLIYHLLQQHPAHPDRGDVQQGETGSKTGTKTFPIHLLPRKLIYLNKVFFESLTVLSRPPEKLTFRLLETASPRDMSKDTIQDD